MAEAGPARRAVDGQARRRVGRALGRRVPRAIGHPHDDRPRPVRDGGARACFTGDLDDVSLLNLLARPRARQHQHAVLDRGRRAGEPRRRRRRVDRARGWPTSSATPIRLERAGPRRSASSDDHVVVDGRRRHRVARAHVVVTVPPALVLEIAFDPVLPDDRLALYRNAIAGPETKTLVVYDEPFWRADGFSGQTSEPELGRRGHDRRVARRGPPGVLASFTFGPRRRARSTRSTPPSAAAACSTRSSPGSGPTAATPGRRSSRRRGGTRSGRAGCSMAHFRPGILTQLRRTCCASRRAASTGPAPRPRRSRTARSTAPSAPASARRRDPRPQLTRDPGRSSRLASRYSVSPGG